MTNPQQPQSPGEPKKHQSSGELLVSFAGFDPAKDIPVNNDILSEMLGDIKKERLEKTKAKAKEMLTKAFELHTQMVRTRQEFQKKEKEFEKQLGKLMGQLRAAMEGKPPPEDPEDKEKSNGG